MSDAADRSDLPGDRFLAYIALAPSAALMLLLIGVPTVTVFMLSLQRIELGSITGPFVGLDNFSGILTDRYFYRALTNTMIWVFGSVSLEMVLGLAIALLLNQNFMFRGAARAIILMPYLIPTVVAVLVWHYMLNDIVGIINYLLMIIRVIDSPLLWLSSPGTAMLSVILVGVWKFFPFVVIALLGILQAIPQEQYEAAQIDGANAWQRFWRITLPYIMPVLLLTALLRTIWAVHKFDIIYLMTGGGPIDATTTLPVLVYNKGFVDFDLSAAAAIAIVTFAIIAVMIGVYLFLMKRAEASQ